MIVFYLANVCGRMPSQALSNISSNDGRYTNTLNKSLFPETNCNHPHFSQVKSVIKPTHDAGPRGCLQRRDGWQRGARPQLHRLALGPNIHGLGGFSRSDQTAQHPRSTPHDQWRRHSTRLTHGRCSVHSGDVHARGVRRAGRGRNDLGPECAGGQAAGDHVLQQLHEGVQHRRHVHAGLRRTLL